MGGSQSSVTAYPNLVTEDCDPPSFRGCINGNGRIAMKRKIIEIDEDKCNGCGACITGCAEGALELVDGKAKLVKEQFCDGLGACIGECPTGALKIIEREAVSFDEEAVQDHLVEKEKSKRPPSGGCPGMQAQTFEKKPSDRPVTSTETGYVLPSELRQWPVQLHLVQPQTSFFKNKEIVLLSTCSPVASADIHWRFLRGRAVVMACPKLDRTEGYVEKLAGIIQASNTPKVIVVRMEVPCCGGLTAMLQAARSQCGRSDVSYEEVVMSLQGEIIEQTQV